MRLGMYFCDEEDTAVILNCWNEYVDKIAFVNRPVEFPKLEKLVNKYCKKNSKENDRGITYEPVYGLENTYGMAEVLLFIYWSIIT